MHGTCAETGTEYQRNRERPHIHSLRQSVLGSRDTVHAGAQTLSGVKRSASDLVTGLVLTGML